MYIVIKKFPNGSFEAIEEYKKVNSYYASQKFVQDYCHRRHVIHDLKKLDKEGHLYTTTLIEGLLYYLVDYTEEGVSKIDNSMTYYYNNEDDLSCIIKSMKRENTLKGILED